MVGAGNGVRTDDGADAGLGVSAGAEACVGGDGRSQCWCKNWHAGMMTHKVNMLLNMCLACSWKKQSIFHARF